MPYLIESKGVIVNISSVSSMKTGDGSLIHSEAKKYSVLSRVGEPEEIAKAVVFLASNTSSFVTGTNMLVDGGSILK
ncbi:short-chain dehydrogenase-like protein [Dinothrombium tinctorium]|uniref:Short-chain dehydrogenase-like protein n=1 Tax=Dinothrombium tinctorium TaxID=1965070 RepID=A0A3S3S1D9_9ACAR|nr:short-chain dehydrogenase-like protein [Dinothrombium tinctorium]